jgi:SAM-dependent methyltransferase
VIRHLPHDASPGGDQPEGADDDHPMRVVTRQVAFEPGGWTPERAAKVAALFDGLAAEWHTRHQPERQAPLVDALERGRVAGGRCAELGSGDGYATPVLAERFDAVVAVDLSLEMLRRAPADVGARVRADAARLPLPDASVDAVVLVNALLFPAEVDRVLRPDGALVWVCSLGDRTPIYLPAADVERALPGRWDGVASAAGAGTWAVLRRAR